MSSGIPPDQGPKADLPFSVTQSPSAIQKPPQAALSSEPFPAFDEKEIHVSRPSDVSTTTMATVRNDGGGGDPFDTDIEARISHGTTVTATTDGGGIRKSSVECTRGGTDCHVWPGQEHWKRKAKAAKKNRHSCKCLQSLSKRNRILVKVLIGLLVVGIAVGVGLGVSKPLGAGIWRSETHNS
ncbi:hypothetical protein VTK26DRAFT_6161 [Humicola hyalothermophila]